MPENGAGPAPGHSKAGTSPDESLGCTLAILTSLLSPPCRRGSVMALGSPLGRGEAWGCWQKGNLQRAAGTGDVRLPRSILGEVTGGLWRGTRELRRGLRAGRGCL